ncbi:ribonuclease H-like domain-containing protein [Tanacetum coccineum]
MDETNNTHPEGIVPDETNFRNDFYENSEVNSETEEFPVHTLRRSSRQTKLPSSLNDFIVEGKVKYEVKRVVNYANFNHDNYCFISFLNKSVEPTFYEEAILDKGIDFDEILSPVVKVSTVRCVIALSVTNNWPLFQLDVNNVFLYGDLDEDMYMTIPKGFASKDNKNKIMVYFSTPMEPNSVLLVPTKDDPLLDNITGYQKLFGKLIYLTHTRPDIAYSVHCLAQYMHSSLKSHLNCALNVLRYLKGAPEAEYRSLSSAACEIIWIQKLLLDLTTKVTIPIDLHCDNKYALQSAINPVFHEKSKHFEIDVHFIREKIAKG